MNRLEIPKIPPALEPAFTERHYRVQDLAAMWSLSPGAVRTLFKKEPGVLRIGQPGSRSKRIYFTMLIPASVAERVYATRCAAS